MSEQANKEDELFWKLSNSMIQHINNEGRDSGATPALAAAALLFSAARFNAHLLARNAENVEQFREMQAEGIAHFKEQFEKMIADNMGDYERNFEQFRAG
jgi:hypothetical protein